MDEWVARYCPWFRFHPDEAYYPVSVSQYLAHCDLLDPLGEVKVPGPLTPLLLDQILMLHPEWTSTPYQYNVALKLGSHNPLVTARGAPNDTLAVHVVEDDTHVYIQYLMFYAYNGASLLLNAFPMGAHEADLESVRAKVCKATGALEGYYLSHHGDATWVTPDELEKEKGQVVIYVAKGSHAHYARPMATKRHYGCCYDYTGRGLLWSPRAFERLYEPGEAQYDPKTMGYLRLRGYLGRNSVAAFCLHDWWDASADVPAEADPLSDEALEEMAQKYGAHRTSEGVYTMFGV